MIPLTKKLSKLDEFIAITEELDRRECRRSCRKFIKRHVKIEDLDSPGIVMPFRLWLGQLKALRAFLRKRLIVVLKARQLGLTWLTLAYAAWRLIFTPGYRVVAISANEDKAKELIRRMVFILEHLPPHIIRRRKGCDPRYTGPVYDDMSLSVTIYHRKGEPSIFQGLPATPGAGRMFTANLLLIDEWAEQQFARDIWTGAYPIVNRPTGGQVIGLSTMVVGTLFDEICRGAEEGTNDFHEVFLDRWTDPRRDQEWFEKTKRAFPNSWRSEYPASPEEARSVQKGAFFEEWQEEIHVPVDHWEPPNDPRWPIIGVYDPGYNQACFKWYTVSPGVDGFPRGWVRCFREYYPKNTIDSVQAQEILRLSCYGDGKRQKIWLPKRGMEIEVPGTPFKFRTILMDSSAETPSRGTGKSTAAVFRDYGIHMIAADKRDVENGWRRLHEWLAPRPYPGREDTGVSTAYLTFTKDCGASRRTYPACVQSKSNPGDISADTPHDPQDCDRYLVMYQPKPSDYTPDPLEDLVKQLPAWTPGYHACRQEILRGDTSREVGLEDLGM